MQLGGYVQITCHVPKNPDNRKIKYGLTWTYDGEVPIEGDSARVTWQMPKIRVTTCDGDTAYCAVTDSMGRGQMAKQVLSIGGCEGQ